MILTTIIESLEIVLNNIIAVLMMLEKIDYSKPSENNYTFKMKVINLKLSINFIFYVTILPLSFLYCYRKYHVLLCVSSETLKLPFKLFCQLCQLSNCDSVIKVWSALYHENLFSDLYLRLQILCMALLWFPA